MVRIFVRHHVADYQVWRQGYDAFGAERGPLGVVGDGVYRTLDDPNDITIWHDFATRDQAVAFKSSPSLRAAMEKAGVVGAPTIWLAEPA